MLTDDVGVFTLIFICGVLIASLIKRRSYGNQLTSVKNALGFAIAYMIIILGTALLSLILQPIALVRIAGAKMLISTFLLVCLISAFCCWFYGAWLGRTEQDQLVKLDVPVAALAMIAVVAP